MSFPSKLVSLPLADVQEMSFRFPFLLGRTSSAHSRLNCQDDHRASESVVVGTVSDSQRCIARVIDRQCGCVVCVRVCGWAWMAGWWLSSDSTSSEGISPGSECRPELLGLGHEYLRTISRSTSAAVVVFFFSWSPQSPSGAHCVATWHLSASLIYWFESFALLCLCWRGHVRVSWAFFVLSPLKLGISLSFVCKRGRRVWWFFICFRVYLCPRLCLFNFCWVSGGLGGEERKSTEYCVEAEKKVPFVVTDRRRVRTGEKANSSQEGQQRVLKTKPANSS